jgi:ABC-type multidrug transport system fused ATPase/permease subunit
MDGRLTSRRLLAAYLWPGRRAAALLGAAILTMTVLPLLAPQFTRLIIDGAIAGEPIDSLITLALLYLAVAVGAQLAKVATAWLASRLAWDGTNRLRERLAERALGLDIAYHGQRTPGELIERVDGDVVALAEFIVAFLLDVLASFLLLVGVLVLVFAADARIGAVLLIYAVAMTVLLVRLQRHAVPAATEVREAMAQLMGNLEERLAGLEDIRANGAGDHVVRRFHEASADVYVADLKAERIGGGVYALTNLAFAGATAVVLAGAVLLTGSNAITIGTAVLLFQYTQMVRTPFERIIDQLQQYQKALASVARIRELLAEQPRVLEPVGGGRPLPPGALSVDLDGVGFAYADDDEVVLDAVNIELPAGSSLGLVGRTGSGKTTIARLLLRLYDPTEGAVRLGGIDLRQAQPASLRHRVAVVTQDVQLFSASVRDNLSLFRDGFDDAQLVDVLDQLGLGPWLAATPDGLDAELGPDGVGLSAGEAQLLAFARAFLSDPGLVVLDEASSRLDPGTEAVIERAIDRLLRNRTAVLIAHRLSSLSRVDTVAVVDGGRIVELGPRERLAADPDSRFAHLLAAAGVSV